MANLKVNNRILKWRSFWNKVHKSHVLLKSMLPSNKSHVEMLRCSLRSDVWYLMAQVLVNLFCLVQLPPVSLAMLHPLILINAHV